MFEDTCKPFPAAQRTFKSFDADASCRRKDVLMFDAERDYGDWEDGSANTFAVGSSECSAVLFFCPAAWDAYNIRQIGEK